MKTAVIMIALGLISAPVDANIYRYADSSGRIFYSNTIPYVAATPSAVKSKRKLRKYARPSSIELAHIRKPVTYSKSHIMKLIHAAAVKHKVDERFVRAVIKTESAYNHLAVSNVGAVGLMQLMPETASRFGVIDRTSPAQSIDGGTKYLKYLMTLFKNNKQLVAAGYNAGENAVIRHRAIPPYPETVSYVGKVMMSYNNII